MAVQIALTVIQVAAAAVSLAGWLRYRSVHRCAVCGSHPVTLFRCEYPDGSWERRCEAHMAGLGA
jgi:formate dehydrogenase maturation protein FdhE